MFKNIKSREDLMADIAVIGKMEKLTQPLISDAAYQSLFHAVEHGDICYLNQLVKVLTPANRLAIVELVKHCTLFTWCDRKNQFGKKDRTQSQAEKDYHLTNYARMFKGNLWDWFESVKLVVRKERNYSRASVAKMLAAYATDNGGSFEGLEAELELAKADAKRKLELQPLIDAKAQSLFAMGLSMAEAIKQAKKMAKDGKLK